jgi:hypothetical protein
MRVMPTKGEEKSSHAIFRAWLFDFMITDVVVSEVESMNTDFDTAREIEPPITRMKRMPSFVMSSEVETSLTISLLL